MQRVQYRLPLPEHKSPSRFHPAMSTGCHLCLFDKYKDKDKNKDHPAMSTACHLWHFLSFNCFNLWDEHVVLGIASGEVFESLPVKLLLQLHCFPALLRHQLSSGLNNIRIGKNKCLNFELNLGGEHSLEPFKIVALRVGVVELQRVDRVPVVQCPQDHLHSRVFRIFLLFSIFYCDYIRSGF